MFERKTIYVCVCDAAAELSLTTLFSKSFILFGRITILDDHVLASLSAVLRLWCDKL